MNIKPIIAAGFLIFATVATPLYGQFSDWTGLQGIDYSDAENWTDGVPEPEVVAGFHLAGDYMVGIDNSEETAGVNISGGNPTFLGGGNLETQQFNIDDGDITVNTEFVCNGLFNLGSPNSSARLFVNAGGQVKVPFGDMRLWGTSDFVFTNALLNADVLNVGHGAAASSNLITASNGSQINTGIARIGQNQTSVASAMIAGANTQWQNDEFLVVGDLGTGQIAVSGGAKVNSDNFVVAARQPSGTGRIFVVGNGSEFGTQSFLVIGGEAASLLDVSDGGLVYADNLTIANDSEANFDSGFGTIQGDVTITDSNLTLANGSSVTANGVVTVEMGGVLEIISSEFLADELIVENGLLTISGTETSLGNVTNMSIFAVNAQTNVQDLRTSGTVELTPNGVLTVQGTCYATGVFVGNASRLELQGDVFPGEGNQIANFVVEGELALKTSTLINMQISTPLSDQISCREITFPNATSINYEIDSGGNFQNGQEIVLIETDEDFASEFINHPEGDTVQSGQFTFTTTYSGGDGNDLALIVSGGSDVLLGDVNEDGVVDLLDVGPFVEVLTSGVFQAEADCNEDGTVDLLDVDPFVSILGG